MSISITGQIFPIFFAVLAGFANGAYLSPLKRNDKINSFAWIAFGLITFFALPLLTLLFVIFQKTFYLPPEDFVYILLVGLVYGLGMYLITKSVQYIGLGIPFALSIATGTLSGSLFSIVMSGHFRSMINARTLIAYLIFIVSILLYSLALSIRDKRNNAMWRQGLLMCITASVLCASQGACLSYFANYFKVHNQGFESQLVPWALIFISCSIIFVASHYIDSRKVKEKVQISKVLKPALLMSLLYAASVVLYTVSITNTPNYSEQYLWVIFMGTIIFSSTLCSYMKGEWRKCENKGNLVNFSAIFCLFISILLLTLSSI